MSNGVVLTKIWFDNDLVELLVAVSDRRLRFENQVYVSHDQLDDLVKDLSIFRDHIQEDFQEIQLGAFGPKYASGAFHARLQFLAPGTLYISTLQQSEFTGFLHEVVASEAKMYLRSEPILLDNFISQLQALAAGTCEEATLHCI
ncbi:hypothetical protein [Luteimonas panaciterrae]|uniref:hypothetical protein n=1 Tax=Luteimonas panaciterrae TaxID=363885 RepID=UPI001CF95AC6|nr:hypothetical protein [Luteimonas panaciterrae]